MCSGGGGGGSDPVTTVIDTVSDKTPTIKIDPQDAVDTISDVTPDIKITDTSIGDVAEQVITVPEVLDKVDEIGGATGEFVKGGVKEVLTAGESVTDAVGEAYEGSDIDTTLETFQGMGELMIDIIDTAISGEDKGKVKDIKQAGSDYQEAWEEVGEDYQEGLDNLQDVTTDTIGTTNQVLTDIGTNVSEQFREAVGLTDEPEGGAVTEETRGGDVERDDLMLTLGKKKSDLKAAKKKGKKGLRIDYGVSLPGSGKAGIAA